MNLAALVFLPAADYVVPLDSVGLSSGIVIMTAIALRLAFSRLIGGADGGVDAESYSGWAAAAGLCS